MSFLYRLCSFVVDRSPQPAGAGGEQQLPRLRTSEWKPRCAHCRRRPWCAGAASHTAVLIYAPAPPPLFDDQPGARHRRLPVPPITPCGQRCRPPLSSGATVRMQRCIQSVDLIPATHWDHALGPVDFPCRPELPARRDRPFYLHRPPSCYPSPGVGLMTRQLSRSAAAGF